MSSILLVVPASKPLLAQFHLVTISLFTFLFDLGVVCVAFFSALTSLADAGENDRKKKKSAGSAAAAVDGQLGT